MRHDHTIAVAPDAVLVLPKDGWRAPEALARQERLVRRDCMFDAVPGADLVLCELGLWVFPAIAHGLQARAACTMNQPCVEWAL